MQGTARYIMVWGSGRLEPGSAEPSEVHAADGSVAIVLERADQLDAARKSGIVGKDSRVFVPGVYDDLDGPIILGYDGSLSDPGGDVQVGVQFFVQTQDYGTSEYLSLIGATLVKIVDMSDFDAFLADADGAIETGTIPDFATHPMLRLCDSGSLGGTADVDGPKLRLYVDRDGAISTSTGGAKLGELGDSLDQLEETWEKLNADSTRPCSVALGNTIDEQKRVSALDERPWLPRYHGALDAVRGLRLRDIGEGADIRVSGFGGRLLPDLEDVDEPRDLVREDVPYVLWTDDSAYLRCAVDDRTFQLSHDAGRAAEALIVHGSVHAAAAHGDEAVLRQVSDHFASVGLSLT